MKHTLLVAGLFLLAPALQSYAQEGYTARDVTLKQAPNSHSHSISDLSANTPLVIIQRQGGWYQVSTAETQGWLKMLSVRYSAAATTAAAEQPQRFRSKTALSTGIRGLSEKGMHQQGAGVDISVIEQLQVSPEDAARFAAEAGLRNQEVDYVAQ